MMELAFLVKTQSSEFFIKVVRNNSKIDPILVEDRIKIDTSLMVLIFFVLFFGTAHSLQSNVATTRSCKDLETAFVVLWLY